MAMHALLHMATFDRPATSHELAACMGANPVHLRRTLAGLRNAGLVRTTKGRGGGWSLARSLDELTLRDVHMALDESPLLAIGHRKAETSCLVEQVVNAALEGTFRDAEAFLLERFASITLDRLAADFEHRLRAHCHEDHHDHG